MSTTGANGGDAKSALAIAPRPGSGWIRRVLERSAVPPRPVAARPERPVASVDANADEVEHVEPRPTPVQSAPPQATLPAQPLPPLHRADDAVRPAPARAAQQAVETPKLVRRPAELFLPVKTVHGLPESQEPTPPPRLDPPPAPETVRTTDSAAEVRPPARLPARQERDVVDSKPQPPVVLSPVPRDAAPPPRDHADAPTPPRDDIPRRLDPTAATAELAPPVRAEAAPARAPAPPPARIQVGRVTVEITPPPPPVAAAAARSPGGTRASRRASGQGARPSSLRFGLGAS
jgi:hypothetical protein